jgi:hypothetical protein
MVFSAVDVKEPVQGTFLFFFLRKNKNLNSEFKGLFCFLQKIVNVPFV